MNPTTGSTLSGSDAAAAACRIGARMVCRSFGAVRANVDVDLTVRPGTVHAVVGENGAGKSTLMRMLYGLDRPDSGSIVIEDTEVELSSPRAAIDRGIGLVQQELAIIADLTLLENLVLGAEPRRAGRIDWKAARDAAEGLAREAGVEVDWSARASETSIAIQQQIEILRLVYRGADVLILDEPTAVLAPAQADELLRLMARLRDAGRTLIFISHKLDEVVAIADDVTVLRAGRTVAQLPRAEVDRPVLAALIIGEGSLPATAVREQQAGDDVLVVSELAARDDKGVQKLTGLSFTVRAGEILGVAAVAGNGQEELAEALIGIRTVEGGSVRIGDRRVDRLSLRRRRQAGMAYVSADRKHEGLALSLSLADNAIAGPGISGLARFGFFSPRRVRERVQQVLGLAAVKYGVSGDPASSLSGGNQQRVVLGRETIGRPRVLVASQPTRGVDLRGIAYIHELLLRARADGAAVVLFSEEIDELRELSDRILVLHRGEASGLLPRGASRAEIGDLMLGRGGAPDDGEVRA